MVQGKITETDTPAVELGATPSKLVSDPPPSFPHFYAGCPLCCNPPNLFWLGTCTGICWIAYAVTWWKKSKSKSIRGFAHAAGFAAARRCLRFLVLVFFRFKPKTSCKWLNRLKPHVWQKQVFAGRNPTLVLSSTSLKLLLKTVS